MRKLILEILVALVTLCVTVNAVYYLGDILSGKINFLIMFVVLFALGVCVIASVYVLMRVVKTYSQTVKKQSKS